MERKWILEPKDLAFCPWVLEVHSGGRRGAWPVRRKCTCSQGQEAGGLPGGGKPGLEPQEQEVSEEQWLVGCFGSAFRNTPVVWLQHSKT